MTTAIGGGGRLLIVDDDAATRLLFRRILEDAGYACEEAADAAAALSVVGEGSADLALCDVMLGDDDGLELARQILTGRLTTAVVMVTGVDDPALATTALEIGAYGYLVKPVRRTELLLNVANALRRRELEVAQRDLVADLEHRVWIRTAELRSALSQVEEAEVHRSQFVQNLSHELRTPLTVILAGASLLPKATQPEQLARMAGTIESQGKRLLLLIERLLQVASLDRPTHNVPLVPIDVRSLLSLVASPARAAGREVEVTVHGDEPLVGSEERLVTALGQLVDNALKFTPPDVRVDLSGSLESNAWVLRVADAGPGIPAEDREGVWAPFVQGDGSATRHHGGVGVGLYLCRRLIEWHGGSTLAYETPGGGLTVMVRLPVVAPEQ